jgi:hypothetical protein
MTDYPIEDLIAEVEDTEAEAQSYYAEAEREMIAYIIDQAR